LADHVYEGMFILDANRYGRDPEGVSRLIATIIQEAGGEILVSRLWEERRLAYPIKGHRKGVYWLTYFRLDAEKLVEIQHRIQITEEVIRSLLLRVEPRIVDTLVAHAKAGTIATYAKPEPAEGEGKSGVEVVAAHVALDDEPPAEV
jgi:small subunit ribosomal protein S6